MSVYWKDVNRGQNLVLSEQEGQEEIIGGYRDTKRGIDAYAQTFGYDPDRSRKGFVTIEDAKDYVEAFKPWELHDVTTLPSPAKGIPLQIRFQLPPPSRPARPPHLRSLFLTRLQPPLIPHPDNSPKLSLRKNLLERVGGNSGRRARWERVKSRFQSSIPSLNQRSLC